MRPPKERHVLRISRGKTTLRQSIGNRLGINFVFYNYPLKRNAQRDIRNFFFVPTQLRKLAKKIQNLAVTNLLPKIFSAQYVRLLSRKGKHYFFFLQNKQLQKRHKNELFLFFIIFDCNYHKFDQYYKYQQCANQTRWRGLGVSKSGFLSGELQFAMGEEVFAKSD